MATAKPSRTAKKIARFLLLLDAIPRFARLLPEASASTAEAILRASGALRPVELDMMRSRWGLRLYEAAEALTGRGQVLWFGLRKRWLAEAVEAAVADGATQLLVVGAGFDPLATLVAGRHPGVLCVEVDAPATAEPKRAGLRGAGLERPNLHVVAADLAARSLDDVLRETPWRADARSVVVAEGLLMYLRASEVTDFFAAVRRCAGDGSRLAFTSVGGDDEGHPRLGVMDRPIRLALRLAGEPMRWGIPPERVRAFVEGAGYALRDQPDLAALRVRFLAPLGLRDELVSPYEHLALAEVARDAS
jgi:methyltransferase (TIGR00027 family)